MFQIILVKFHRDLIRPGPPKGKEGSHPHIFPGNLRTFRLVKYYNVARIFTPPPRNSWWELNQRTPICWRFFFFWSDLDPTYPKSVFGGWCSRKVDTCWHQNTIKYQMIGNTMRNACQHVTLKMFLLGQLASGLDVSPIYDIRWVYHKHFGGYENLNKSGFHQFIRIQPTTSCIYLLDNKCRWSFPSPPK